MGWVEYTHIDGQRYRYSVERRFSGSPVAMERLKEPEWRPVRNMDVKDSLWSVSLGLDWEHRPTP